MQSGLIIKNPTIKVRLLNYSEFAKVQYLKQAGESELKIAEEIFACCYLGILEHEDEVLEADKTAFFIDMIASKVLQDTQRIVLQHEDYFVDTLRTLSKVEVWAGYVAKTLNHTYTDVLEKPVDELLRLYAVAHLVSRGEVPSLVSEEDVIN
jgi:hypothetical protein